MAEIDFSNHTPGRLVLEPPETAEDRAHRLAEAAKNAAFKRGIGYAIVAVAIASGGAAIFGPLETRSFAANTWWTLVGAGVGYVLGKQDS